MKQRKRIYNSLVSFIIAIVIIPLLIVAGVIEYNIRDSFTKNFNDVMSVNMDKVSQRVDMLDKSSREAVGMLALDPNARTMLNNLENEKWFRGTLQGFLNSHRDITSAYIGLINGKMITEPEQKFSNDYDSRKRPWYQKAVLNPEEIILTEPYEDATEKGKFVVTYAKAVKNQKDGQIQAVVAIDIKLTTIADEIANLKTKDNGYFALIDTSGRILAHRDSNVIGKTQQEEKWIEGIKSSNTNPLIQKINGVKYISFSQINKITGWTIAGFIPFSNLSNKLLSFIVSIIGLTIFSLTVAIFIGRNFSIRITRPIEGLVDILSKASRGDFSDRVKENELTSYEVYSITKAVNSMIEHMVSVLSNVKLTSKNIKDSSDTLVSVCQESTSVGEEMAKAIRGIADGATEQATALEDSSNLTIELGEEVDRSLHNSENMIIASQNVKKATKEGKLIISDLVDIFAKTSSANNEVAKNVETLAINSSKVSAITDTIKSITKQTNFIALNASIEAARAGEAGRGFAVVAEEVRKLAEQSAVSASQINDIINEIKQNIEMLAVKITSSIELNKETGKSIDLSNDVFIKIEQTTKTLKGNIEKVIHSLVEINNKKDLFIEDIVNVTNVAQNIAATTEAVSTSTEEQTAGLQEVVGSVEKLNEMAEKLDLLIEKFRV